MDMYLSPFEHLSKIRRGVYLESGYLRLNIDSQCTPEAYKPATLHFDASTAAYNASIPDPVQLEVQALPLGTNEGDYPFFGNTPSEGQESKAVGCLSKSFYVEDACDNVHSSETAVFCSSGIITKKQTQLSRPSSLYSGKLRLFVQAFYGSDEGNTEYLLDDNYNLSLFFPGTSSNVSLSRGFNGGSFIYTTDDFLYFHCVYDLGVLRVYQMPLSFEGESFRTELLSSGKLNDAEFVRKIEACILSTASISPEPMASLVITGDTVLGAPLDYGWHASWDGRTAHAVCHVIGPSTEQPEYLANKYRLDVSRVFDEELQAFVWSASNTAEVANSRWWCVNNGINVFYYDFAENSMYPVPYPSNGSGGQVGSFDAPLYCYYDHDVSTGVSSLKTVSIFMDVINNGSYVFTRTALGAKIYDLDDYLVNTDVWHNGLQGPKGFRVTGASDVSVTNRHTSASTHKWRDGAVEFWALNLNTPFNADDAETAVAFAALHGLTIGETKTVTYEGEERTAAVGWQSKSVIWNTRTVSLGGESFTGSCFGQISVGSCEEFIFGEETDESGGASSVLTGGTPNWVDHFGGRLVWHVSGLTQIYSVVATPTQPYYTYNTAGVNVGATVTDTAAYGPNYTFKYSRMASDKVTESTGVIQGDGRYFHPSLAVPKTGTIDLSRMSLQGVHKTDHTLFTSTDSKWVGDSAVGWV